MNTVCTDAAAGCGSVESLLRWVDKLAGRKERSEKQIGRMMRELKIVQLRGNVGKKVHIEVNYWNRKPLAL